MSKKDDDDDEERTMLVGKIDDGKKKFSRRRQWLEKRRRRRKRRKRSNSNSGSNIIDQNQKHRNADSGGRQESTVRSVSTSRLLPLSWSSKSLISQLSSTHHSKRTCLERHWQWSKCTEKNSSSLLLDQNKQILFHPRTSSSTEVILSDRPLPADGKHYWEIYVPAIYGTSIMFGIASKWRRLLTIGEERDNLPLLSDNIYISYSFLAREQQLISSSFTNLLGIDQHGWGLSHHGLLWHNGIARSYLSQPMETLQPVLVGLEFDADARTLAYTINNQSCGIAFHSIPTNVSIYPAVSSTSAQSTMVLKHCCKICSSLRELCLKSIQSLKFRESLPYQLLPRHLVEQLTD